MRVGSFVLAAQFPGQGQGEALHRAVRSAEVAEEAGLDAVWLAEHHFVPYGVCPSAITLAALLLGRTRRIRVGTAVSVLPTAHPVALGEQAALLHLTSGGRFTLGVGRGGPWVDLEVFGAGLEAYERGFPESLDLLLRWLREPAVGATGERFTLPRGPGRAAAVGGTDATPPGPEVVVACTSPASVRLAAERGLPMLLGHALRATRRRPRWSPCGAGTRAPAGHPPDGGPRRGPCLGRRRPDRGPAPGRGGDAAEGDAGLAAAGAGRPCHGGRQRTRAMRDPLAYTELLCGLHPVGPPRLCADRLAATCERTGITRFALLVEGSGDLAATEENVRRLGAEVLPHLG